MGSLISESFELKIYKDENVVLAGTRESINPDVWGFLWSICNRSFKKQDEGTRVATHLTVEITKIVKVESLE